MTAVLDASLRVDAVAAVPTPRLFAAAFLSAGLLWVSFFPLDFGPAAWAALVPLLVLVRAEASGRRLFLAAYLGGLLFYTPALAWLSVADPRMNITWAGLALYCSLYFPLTVWLLRRLDRSTRLPLLLTVPLVWTALEYLRAHFLTGFAWYFLAHTQHHALPLIQVADFGGAYAVSFLVATVNAVIFEGLAAVPVVRRVFRLPTEGFITVKTRLLGQAVAVGLLTASVAGYGFARLQHAPFPDGPRVALIQGSVDQRIKNARHAGDGGAANARTAMVRPLVYLTEQAVAATPRPDLIIWPETSYPYDWFALAPGVSEEGQPEDVTLVLERKRKLPKETAALWKTNVLFGLNAYIRQADGEEPRYNSALLLTATGEVGGRYDKMHGVPFGEYVPLRETLPVMKKLAPYDFDYSILPGEEFTRFPLTALDGRRFTFGTIICYEDTDPLLARQYVAPGEPAVDFLVNISNDGWFDGTWEHEQHLAICRFRAVECRRAVARAVNMGVSAVIDGDGRVVALPGPTWHESKKVEAVVAAAVPLDDRVSGYARFGDWLPQFCWLGLIAGLLIGRFGPRQESPTQTTASVSLDGSTPQEPRTL